jgi:hypothetical protein
MPRDLASWGLRVALRTVPSLDGDPGGHCCCFTSR